MQKVFGNCVYTDYISKTSNNNNNYRKVLHTTKLASSQVDAICTITLLVSFLFDANDHKDCF